MLLKQRSLSQIRHCLTGHNQIWHYLFYQIIFNDFQNRNSSVLWLKWKQTMEMKENQTFSMGNIQIWHHIFFNQKVLKHFNDIQNQNFMVLWLQWNQRLEMKQNQTSFHRTYSNLAFFISQKTLKHFNDFYNWHFPNSLQKWAKTSKVKWN